MACGPPLSLSEIPSDRIIRLAGLTAEQLAVSLDPLPAGAPVVIRYGAPRVADRSRHVVDDVLERLEALAVDVFPAWLPDAGVIDTSTDVDRRVVRELAHRHATGSSHFGPFLADMAEAALRGCPADRRFGPEVRANGLTRLIADSYRRDGVVLFIGATDELIAEQGQRCVAVALEWLVGHGTLGVWLPAGALPLIDRYPTCRLSVPGYVAALASDAPAEAPTIDYPALAGLPHPASAAEQALERYLARCDWAAGRTWNQAYASHSLAPPIRVDLMWPAERCVVEIDGPDHRQSLKYAADRRRDNGLVLDGFAVLRFTNDEIGDDPQQVLNVIRSLLATRRINEGNLA